MFKKLSLAIIQGLYHWGINNPIQYCLFGCVGLRWFDIITINTGTENEPRTIVYKRECFLTVLGENREVIERTERGQTTDFL